MKNAYTVLGLSQNANAGEIVRSQAKAMIDKIYTPNEIAVARKQLSDPASRLAVDFTYPITETTNIPTIITSMEPNVVDFSIINSDALSSIK